MDLRAYFKRIREIEQSVPEPFVVIISESNDDGSQAGVRTEVSRYLAAKMVVERRAHLATAEETQEFHKEQADARRSAEQLAAANRMQITVVPPRAVKS